MTLELHSIHLRLDFSASGGGKPVLWHTRLATVIPRSGRRFEISFDRRWESGGKIHWLQTEFEMEIVSPRASSQSGCRIGRSSSRTLEEPEVDDCKTLDIIRKAVKAKGSRRA